MNDGGWISFRIKDEALKKRYRDTLKRCVVSESEFLRLSLRNTITFVEVNGHLPIINTEG